MVRSAEERGACCEWVARGCAHGLALLHLSCSLPLVRLSCHKSLASAQCEVV